MIRFRSALLSILPLTMVAAASAETFDDVVKALDDKAKACKSIQCKVRSETDMQMPEMKYSMKSEMTFEAMKKGDKWLYRSEGTTKSVTSTKDAPENKQDSKQLMIQDEQFSWIYTETNGQKSAMKSKASNQFAVMADKATIDEMKKLYDFKLVGDESHDGKSCWLVEATPKDAATAAAGMAKMLTWYDKQSGVGIKSVGKDKADKVVMTSLTTDVKIDGSIAADRFVFKAPEGVQVMDMTQTGENPPAAEGGAKPEEQPKEEPKKESEQPKKGEDKPLKPKLPKLP